MSRGGVKKPFRARLFLADDQQARTFHSFAPWQNSLLDFLPCLLFSLIFSLAWAAMALKGVGLRLSFGSALLLQLVVVLGLGILIMGFRHGRRAFLIFLSVPLLLLALSAFIGPAAWQSFWRGFALSVAEEMRVSALWSFAKTQADLVKPDSYESVVAFVPAFFSILLIWLKPMPIPLALLMLFPFLAQGGDLGQAPENVFYLLACLSAVACSYSRSVAKNPSDKRRLQWPPLLLIIVLLLVSMLIQTILPEHFFREPRLADRMHELQRRFGAPETVNYYEFSLRQAGYYPLGERLGGPLQLTGQNYMIFTGPQESIYLRGAVAEEYSGDSWIGEAMEPNYIFRNDEKGGIQADSLGYPDSLAGKGRWLESFFTRGRFLIEPLQLPVQVIFNGGRPTRIDSEEEEEQIFYFNRGGQIYAGRAIDAQGYRVDGWYPQRAAGAEMDLRLREAVSSGDVRPEYHVNNDRPYQATLSLLEPELARLVYEEKGDDAGRLETVMAIRRFLAEKYQYDLQPSQPAANEDFLNSFLAQKRGYCVYFATAMTLLAREAGFHSRYVEGFLVPGVDGNEEKREYRRLVLTDSAHAWSEIYFEGLGWLPFDATPSDELSSMARDEEEQEKRDREKPSEATRPPTESSSPSPSRPSEAPSFPQSASQSQEASPSPPPPPQQSPEAEAPPLNPVLKKILWILALLLLLFLAVALWLRRRALIFRRRHDENWLLRQSGWERGEVIFRIWQDMKEIYRLTGGVFPLNATLLKSFAQIEHRFPAADKKQGRQAFLIVERALYGNRLANDLEIKALLDYHRLMETQLRNQLPRGNWLLRRWLFPSGKAL